MSKIAVRLRCAVFNSLISWGSDVNCIKTAWTWQSLFESLHSLRDPAPLSRHVELTENTPFHAHATEGMGEGFSAVNREEKAPQVGHLVTMNCGNRKKRTGDVWEHHGQ